jgi:hypothetical protein
MLVKCHEHLHPIIDFKGMLLIRIFLIDIEIWIFLNNLQV